jgi:hypothetical protein
MVENEPLHRLVEAAKLSQKLATPLRMELDLRELIIVERSWFLEDRVGHRQLAHVVQ